MIVRIGACAAAVVILLTSGVAAQIGGKPVKGNPTPGTEQPAPPNLADRVTVTGCLQLVSKNAAAPTGTVDGNTVVDSRFELTGVERQSNVPVDTGGSAIAAGTSSATYRLAAIESQLSPFVGKKIEISGEILQRTGQRQADPPTLQVEFVQKLSATCR